MCALDQEHAKLISASEDELEVEALSRVTVDTRWKINLYRWAPSRAKSKEIVNLLFAVQSQTAFLRQSSWLTSASLKTWAPYSPGGTLSSHLVLTSPEYSCNILAGLGNSGSWQQLHRCHSWRSLSYFANSGKQVWSATILGDQALPGWGNHVGHYPFQMILTLWPLHHSQNCHDGSCLGVASWLPCKL